MFSFLNAMFESLSDVSTSPWFYLIIFSVALLDSVVPIVPSESMVIVGGVVAGLGDLHIPLVIVIAAAGAFLGDNMSYLIGRKASAFVDRRYRRTEKGANRLDWAHSQIEDRGGPLLITARWAHLAHTYLWSHTSESALVCQVGRYCFCHLGFLCKHAGLYWWQNF